MTKKISTKSAAAKSAATKSAATKNKAALAAGALHHTVAKPRVITSFALQTPEAVAAAYAPVAPRPKHKAVVTAGKKVAANTAEKRVASKKVVSKKVASKKAMATKPKTTTLDAILKPVADAAWAKHPNNPANRTSPASAVVNDEALAAVGLTDETLDSLPDTAIAETEPEIQAPQPTQDEPRGRVKKMMALSAVVSAAKHHAPAPVKPPATALTKVLDKARFQFVRAEQGSDGVAAYGYAHPDGRAALYTAHQDDVNRPETVVAKLETGQTIQVSSNQPDAAKSLWEVLRPVSKKEHRIRQARYDGERGAAELRGNPLTTPRVTETPEQALAVIRMVADQAAADTAAIAAEPVNGVPAHVVHAIEMLGMITGQKFNISDLRGDKNYSHRLSLLKKLFNRERVLVEETGVNNLIKSFYSAAGVGEGTLAAQAAEFTARCKDLVTVSRTIKRAVKKATKKVLRAVRRAKLPALTVPGRVLEVSKPLNRKQQRISDAAARSQIQADVSDGRQLAQPHPVLKGLVVTDARSLRIFNRKDGVTSLKLERCNSQGALHVWDNGSKLCTGVLTPVLVKDVKPQPWDAVMIGGMVNGLLESKSERTQEVETNLQAAKVALQWCTGPARLVPTALPIPVPRAAASDVVVKANNVRLLEDPLSGLVFVQLERGNSQGAAVVYNNNSAITTGICPPEWLSKFRVVTAAGGCAIKNKHGHAFTDQDLARAINQLLNPETPGVAVTPTAARHLTAVLDSIEEKRIMATNANAISASRKFAATTAAAKTPKPVATKAAAATKTAKSPATKTERAPRTSSMAGKTIKVLNAKHEARKGSLRQIGLDIILKSKTVDAALPLLKKAGANGSFIKFAVDQKFVKLV